MKKFLVSVILLALVGLSFGATNEMEYETVYMPKLKKQQERLARVESNIKEEETKIADLKTKITATEQETEKIWNEIYALVGSDKAGVEAFGVELENLKKEIRRFGALPAEELYKRKAELDGFDAKIEEFRKDKRSLLTVNVNNLEKMSQTIKSIRSSIVVPYVTSYVVNKGDNLWKISGKKDIYDDPFKWTDIYKANKETIKGWQRKFNATLKEGQQEADLIYPEQEFTIPR